jgi:hypothetical protein
MFLTNNATSYQKLEPFGYYTFHAFDILSTGKEVMEVLTDACLLVQLMEYELTQCRSELSALG